MIEQIFDTDIEGDTVFDVVSRLYGGGKSLKAISRETSLSEQKVRKILITKTIYSTQFSDKIPAMLKEGKSINEIGRELKLMRGAITSYLPYGYETI